MRRPDIFRSDKDISESLIGPWSVSLHPFCLMKTKLTNEWWDILCLFGIQKNVHIIHKDEEIFIYLCSLECFGHCYQYKDVDQLIAALKECALIFPADV